MSPTGYRLALIVGGTSAILSTAACWAAEQGVVFNPSPAPAPSAAGQVLIAEPADGQFVYSGRPQPMRPRARFAIGNLQSTDATVYSAEEQVELRALEARLSATAASAAAASAVPVRLTHAIRSVVRHPASKVACTPAKSDEAMSTVSWPKVVRDDRKVCVPKLEFADQGDWRDHLWCFDKGDGNVR